jgi:GR25 family glycosyltransferase involved in LPS biosynthesis
MSDLRAAAKQALEALQNCANGEDDVLLTRDALAALRAALEQPERHLTDEVIADLWHQNGGFHHHFARAIERWLKGGA